jgi:hypothetical protein
MDGGPVTINVITGVPQAKVSRTEDAGGRDPRRARHTEVFAMETMKDFWAD